MKLFAMLAATFMILGQASVEVPVDQEPQHKVVFKNDFVRVIDATLPPGYVTLNHRHDVDNVSVTMSNGRDGDAALRGIGRAGFAKGGYAHSVTNSGPGVMRFIVVELLKPDRPTAPSVGMPKHVLETENDRVRIYRVKLAPGESLESHSHNTGWVEVTVTGRNKPGSSAWHAAGEQHALTVGAADPPLEIVELEPK
jgi:predicted metal-dependent enzyme (double-stranded beta helix superfamily)